jgi:hypothetical protein
MAKSRKQSQKKIGRNVDSPGHKRYNAERRWITHKVNHIVRYMKRHKNWKLPSDLNDEVKTYVQVRLKK